MEPKRPWWRKKRWQAAIVLWLSLPILYVFSAGPAAYGYERGWLSPSFYISIYYNPMYELRSLVPVDVWMKWCATKGHEHESDARLQRARRMPQP